MSTFFLIAPYRPDVWNEANTRGDHPYSALRIDPNIYDQSLRRRWPQAEAESPPPDSPYARQWRLPALREGLSGFHVNLWRNMQVVTFDTDPKQTFLDFVLWHRGFVSPDHRLYLFNSTSSDSLELSAITKTHHIIAFTGLLD